MTVASLHAQPAKDATFQFQPPKVLEPKIPRRTVNVTQFGAVPDGKTLNTDAIIRAIAALEEKGGGQLIFPPGIWLTGPIGLKSKIELHLEDGALIQFTPGYERISGPRSDMNGEKGTSPLRPL